MALDNNTVGYLLDPAFQIEGINGKPAVGGHIEVFLAGTDSKYISYQNFDGTYNPFKVPLSNDGRAVIIANASQSYDVYFYDSFNNLMFSRLNVFPDVAGDPVNINGYYTRIKNTDDTLDITVTGSMTGKNDYTVNTNHIPLGVEDPLYWESDTSEGAVIGLDIDATGKALNLDGKMDVDKLTIEGGYITAYDGQPFAGGGGSGGVTKKYVDDQDQKIVDDLLDEVEDREEADKALDDKIAEKQDKLTAGDNITIVDNVISAVGGGTTYTAGDNIQISKDNVISATDTKYTSGDGIQINDENEISIDDTVATKDDLNGFVKDITSDEETIQVTKSNDKVNLEATKYYLDNSKDSYSIKDLVNNETEVTINGTDFKLDLEDYPTTSYVSIEYRNYTDAEHYTTETKTFTGVSEGVIPTNAFDIGLDSTVIKVTSCSPYMLNDGNNLVVEGEVEKKEVQEKLTAGTNITISDDGVISAAGTVATEWGNISGSISNQTDLSNALDNKQDKLTAGNNITITDNVISATVPDTYATKEYVDDAVEDKQDKLTAGDNITIENNVISATGSGKTYTGVAPIVVDNDNSQITADTTYIVAGTNIDLSVDSEGNTVISSTAEGKTYTAGDNIQISDDNVISATDTKYTSGTGIAISDDNVISNTIDSYTKTESDTKYQEKLTAGENITIVDNVISSSGSGKTYTGGDGIDVDNTENTISLDDDTQSAIGSISDAKTLTAGSNITITEDSTSIIIAGTAASYKAGDNIAISDNNVISAVDTTYTAGDGISISTTNVISSTNPVDVWDLVAGEDIIISKDTATETITISADIDNFSDMFIGTYSGSSTDTTYSEFKEAADAGKEVLIKWTVLGGDVYARLEQIDDSKAVFIRTTLGTSTIADVTINRIIVFADGTSTSFDTGTFSGGTTYTAGTGIDISNNVISSTVTFGTITF